MEDKYLIPLSPKTGQTLSSFALHVVWLSVPSPWGWFFLRYVPDWMPHSFNTEPRNECEIPAHETSFLTPILPHDVRNVTPVCVC